MLDVPDTDDVVFDVSVHSEVGLVGYDCEFVCIVCRYVLEDIPNDVANDF